MAVAGISEAKKLRARMRPDWQGRTAVVVATGPSVHDAPLSAVRGCAKVIVINDAFRLVPWADVLYASDLAWWESNEGVPQFRGLKVSASARAAVLFPDIRTVRFLTAAKMIVEPIGTLGSGSRQGNGGSGFHAVNLAVQFGARRIVLVGFDMRYDLGTHWYVDAVKQRKDAKGIDECREALDGCASQLTAWGVGVLNTSSASALKAYPKVTLMEAIS